ncbi:MAG: FAD-dependent oxidoreductase [Ignavibacteria bacterium]|nr:FAD-dependent oxidoreductase [Ignavibacteria bacterium]
MLNNEVAIVGCGVSGISASIHLSRSNIPHTIFERRNFIGGRIFSFFDEKFSYHLDNGQHIFSSAYKNFFEILTELNTIEYLDYQKKFYVPFIQNNSKKFYLKSSFNNSKFGLLFGILVFNLLTLKNRVELIKFFHKFSRNHLKNNYPVALDFLVKNEQSPNLIKYFWEPFCTAVFNSSLSEIPTSLLTNVIRLTFLNDKNKLGFVFSKVPLSQLTKSFLSYINTKSIVDIRLGTSITKIKENNKSFILYDQSGQAYEFRNIIFCIPPNFLSSLILEEWKNFEYFNFFNKIKFNPIVSIYASFNYEFCKEKFAHLVGSPIHWVFNKTRIENIQNSSYLYSFTSSNSTELMNQNNLHINEILLETINQYFKPKLKLNPINIKIIKDKFATISISPEFEKVRPSQLSPIEGIYIAGDWTKTELPATLESASLSGKLAANFLLNKLKKI